MLPTCWDKAQRWRENKAIKAKNMIHFSFRVWWHMINSRKENLIIRLKSSLTNLSTEDLCSWGLHLKNISNSHCEYYCHFCKHKTCIPWGRNTTKSRECEDETERVRPPLESSDPVPHAGLPTAQHNYKGPSSRDLLLNSCQFQIHVRCCSVFNENLH